MYEAQLVEKSPSSFLLDTFSVHSENEKGNHSPSHKISDVQIPNKISKFNLQISYNSY